MHVYLGVLVSSIVLFSRYTDMTHLRCPFKIPRGKRCEVIPVHPRVNTLHVYNTVTNTENT